MYVVLCLSAILTALCNGFPMGAPDAACDTMTPQHGVTPQTIQSPFKIFPESNEVDPGKKLLVRLVAPQGLSFRGFLLQARNSSTSERVGIFFVDQTKYSVLTCGRGVHNTVTHRDSTDKTEVQIEWEAPRGYTGDIVFRSSFVQNYQTVWVGEESSTVRVKRSVTGEQTTKEPTSEPEPETTEVAPEAEAESEDDDKHDKEDGHAEGEHEPEPESEAESSDDDDKFYSECNKSSGCFGLPPGCVEVANPNCELVVSYRKERNGRYMFKLRGKGNGYMAVGLSTDSKMGDDSVAECVQEGGRVNVYQSYNEGKSNKRVSSSNQVGITDVEGSYSNGVFECAFSRSPTWTSNGRKYNLETDIYNLIIAKGNYNDGKLSYHGHDNRLFTETPIALSSLRAPRAGSGSNSELFVTLHASFMIGAWIASACCGMLVARYFKDTWSKSTICGKAVWFGFHRFFVILAWSLTVAAFVLIWYEKQEWTTYWAHGICGTVTTGLCFIQPFIALCRCEPDARKRPIFNWIHWLVGNSAHVVGVATIFLARGIEYVQLPSWTYEVLLAYVAFHFLIHILMTIHTCWSDKKNRKHKEQYSMKELGLGHSGFHVERKRDAPGSCFRKFILAVYIIVVWLFAALLILMVIFKPFNATLSDWGILN